MERQARASERGLWAERGYRPLTPRAAAALALAYNDNCLRGRAPYRIIEARISAAEVLDRRASFTLDGAPAESPFAIVLFGSSFANWDGPPLRALAGVRVRARGTLGVYRAQPQLCLDHSSQIEVLRQ